MCGFWCNGKQLKWFAIDNFNNNWKLTVNDLLQKGWWNVNELYQLMFKDLVWEIESVSVSTNANVEDQVVWRATYDGKFIVQSGYL